MKNTTLLKKIRKKTWAVSLTVLALLCYLSFLFIPTNSQFTNFLPYTVDKIYIQGSLLDQIIYIFTHFSTAFQNLNILHYATFALIGFMIVVLISSLIALFYRRRAIYKTNIFHAGLAIGVVLFYIIALMQQNILTNVRDLFLNANNEFTFLSPTYLPLMAVVALVIAIISSFSAVHAKAFFRILMVAIACLSLAIFLFPMVTKNTDYNFVQILFTFNTNALVSMSLLEQIIFMTLACAVLVNFILIIFYLGSHRYGLFMIIVSAIYVVIAIAASIFVLLTIPFNVFKNATMYVLVSSIAQLVLIWINAAISKSSFKNQVDVLVKKHETVGSEEENAYYFDESDTQQVTVSYITETQENDPTIIISEIENAESEEPVLSKKERRKQEKLNKKLQKQLAKQNATEEPIKDEINSRTIIISEIEDTESEEPALSKKERRKQEKLNKKLQKQLAKQNAAEESSEEEINNPTIIVSEIENAESEEPALSKKERRKQEKLNKKLQKQLAKQNAAEESSEEEINNPTIIVSEIENAESEEPALSKKERRKQEKLNKKLQKQLAKQNANAVEEPSEELNQKDVQSKSNELPKKEFNIDEILADLTPIYTPSENAFIEDTLPLYDTTEDDSIFRPATKDSLRRESIRQRLEELKLNRKFIDEARRTLNSLNATQNLANNQRAAEYTPQDTYAQQDLERLQMQKYLLEQQLKAQQNAQEAFQTQQAQQELERAQLQNQLLEQQLKAQQNTQEALQAQQAQQELQRAQLQNQLLEQQLKAQQKAQEALQAQARMQQPIDNDLSFLSVNPEYKSMTSAAYNDVPLTEEEERDPFIKTLTAQERLEFYENFLEPSNHKIPAYILGQNNTNFFDIVVVYIGSFAGKISFELITKILDYSDTL